MGKSNSLVIDESGIRVLRKASINTTPLFGADKKKKKRSYRCQCNLTWDRNFDTFVCIYVTVALNWKPSWLKRKKKKSLWNSTSERSLNITACIMSYSWSTADRPQLPLCCSCWYSIWFSLFLLHSRIVYHDFFIWLLFLLCNGCDAAYNTMNYKYAT